MLKWRSLRQSKIKNAEIRIIYFGLFGDIFSHYSLENESELSLYSGDIVNSFFIAPSGSSRSYVSIIIKLTIFLVSRDYNQ